MAQLYIAAIPDSPPGVLRDPARQAYVKATAHEGLRRQRYYAWKLLEYGLRHSLGLEPESIPFYRDPQGKWGCENCFFSLSHTDGAVAVAISDRAVGVDLEKSDRRISAHFEAHLTDRERAAYEALPPEKRPYFLLSRWCGKESLYKTGNYAPFRQLETEGVCTGTLRLGSTDYTWAVTEKATLHTDICL